MAELQDPAYLDNGCITAQGDRQVHSSLVCSEGVAFGVGGELEVTQRGAGANMSVDVASGNAFVAGTQASWQGMYHVSNDATKNIVVPAADPTDDRIDLVVARVRDSSYAGVTDDWSLDVVTGSPSPSPVAPSLPDNSLMLAEIAVAAGTTSIVDANITDGRVGYGLCAGGPDPLEILVVSDGTFDPATVPGYRYLEVEVQAGGGGGGGASATDNSFGGGGGAGAYARQIIFADDLTGPVTLTVGAGGVGGGGADDGDPGGTSSFGSIIVCGGGQGGGHSVGLGTANGGNGGAVSAVGGGGYGIPGGAGGYGWGLDSPILYPGKGGDSHLGFGGKAILTITNDVTTSGNDGTGYGSGGGGGLNTGASPAAGGNGQDGLISIRIYY